MKRTWLLVVGLLSVGLLLATASPAFATTRKTRITGLTAAIAAPSYRATGLLTYARSGRNYAVALQYVKVYRYIGGRWVYHARMKTTTSGRFTFNEPAGYTYKVVYTGVSGRYYRCTWTVKITPPVTGVATVADTLAIPFGEQTAPASGDMWWMSGQTRKPLVGVQLTVSRDGGPALATVGTDEFGTWTLDLPAGDYRISYPGGRTLRACSATFTIAPAAATELTSSESAYVLSGGSATTRVSGLLRADFGTQGVTWTPLAGVALLVRDGADGTVLATAVTDVDGAWSADLPAGSYVVQYSGAFGMRAGDGLAYNVQSALCEFGVVLYPTLDAFAEVIGLAEYAEGEPTTGTVVLRDASGAPIPLASPLVLEVQVWSGTPDEGEYVVADTVTTDADGGWSVEGLGAGDYLLAFADVPDYVVNGTHYYVQTGGDLSFWVYATEPPLDPSLEPPLE